MIRRREFIEKQLKFGLGFALLAIPKKDLGFDDFGLISIMYHRFNEGKYPSTNIELDIFKEQLKIIEDEGIQFVHPNDFEKSLTQKKRDRKKKLQKRKKR